MTEFKIFKSAVQKNISRMTKGGALLYTTDIDKDDLWVHYLSSYPEGTNGMHKSRLVYDCTACKQFVRGIGNVVTLVDNKPVSIWRVASELPSPFDVVAKALADLVESRKIADRFLSEFSNIGVDSNKQMLDDGKVVTWEHFYCQLPQAYVGSSGDIARHRDSKALLHRALTELSQDSCSTVKELIEQGGVIYRGEENLPALKKFMEYKEKYDKVADAGKENWLWENSHNNQMVAHIRNTAFGTLLVDLSAGVELDEAVFKFNKIMSPDRYQRPTPVLTKKTIESAQRRVAELGLNDSLERRFAVADDVAVADVLFVDRSVQGRMVGGSVVADVFDSMVKESDVSTAARSADKAEEIKIEDFLSSVLKGGVSSIEMLVEGRHAGNLMSLVSPVHKDAPSLLKWSNNFGWAYNGDVTDSVIKANVKSAGGKVDGVLRFSIQWNDGSVHNPNDFDAHCREPGGDHIYYGTRGTSHKSSGSLDVDIIHPEKGKAAVENIVWTNKASMPGGVYRMSVHNFSHNGGRTGFSAEIEFDGTLHHLSYPKELRHGQTVEVAEVSFNKKEGTFTLKPLIDCTQPSKDIWGVSTQSFVPVSMMMLSPNHWAGQHGVGNKHYMFILKGCKNPGTPRGFFNEFLRDDLRSDRKVFEALGSRMRVAPSEDQLSGLGFSSTISNSIVVKVSAKGPSRMYKVVF